MKSKKLILCLRLSEMAALMCLNRCGNQIKDEDFNIENVCKECVQRIVCDYLDLTLEG